MSVRSSILSLIFSVLLFVLPEAQERKEVLVISSYNSRFPTFFQQIEGIQSVFDTNYVDFDLEFMDSKRFPDAVSKSLFADLLTFKMKQTHPYDAIIATDDNALNFVIEHQSDLFVQIPIVFCGINDAELAIKQNQNPWITGVVEAVSMEETIQLMLQWFPDQSTIYAIVDNTTSGKADLRTFYRVAESYPNVKFREISLQNQSFEEFEQQLQSFPANTPVLLLSAYQDKNHVTLNFQESIALVSENLKAPIFHLYQHGIGDGAIGGKIISHYEQGKTAALVVADILSGLPINSISVIQESPNVYMLDYEEVTKHNFNLSDLPDDAVIINQPETFFTKYRRIINVTILIFSILVVFIIILSVNIFRRKEAENRLLEQNENYQQLNAEYLIQNEELTSHRNHLQELVKEKTNDLVQKNDLLEEKNVKLEQVLSDLKEAQLQVVQSEKMASLGLLTAGVAHEINNPLNYISGSYSLLEHILKKKDQDDEQIQELLKNLKIGVDRATDIVKSLNQFSRPNNNLKEECPIHTIIDNCLLILNHKIKRQITVEKEYYNTDLYCFGSVGKLHQVFTNILTNSVQAIDGKGTIKISTWQENDQIMVQISDTGCGIEKENLKKIFDPFFTTKEPGVGTGLGMSITHKIINEHNGTIQMSSEVGKGTTSTIMLPVNSVVTES